MAERLWCFHVGKRFYTLKQFEPLTERGFLKLECEVGSEEEEAVVPSFLRPVTNVDLEEDELPDPLPAPASRSLSRASRASSGTAQQSVQAGTPVGSVAAAASAADADGAHRRNAVASLLARSASVPVSLSGAGTVSSTTSAASRPPSRPSSTPVAIEQQQQQQQQQAPVSLLRRSRSVQHARFVAPSPATTLSFHSSQESVESAGARPASRLLHSSSIDVSLSMRDTQPRCT